MALVTLHVMSEHWKYLSAVQSKGSCGIEDGDVIGGGLGHGIGMSQYGANGCAQDGMTMEQILQTYYPGTQLYQLYT